MCRRAGLVGTVLSLRILVLEDTRSCDAVLLLLLLLHVAWHGVAWRGVAWRVAWRGVAWRGVAWRGGVHRKETKRPSS